VVPWLPSKTQIEPRNMQRCSTVFAARLSSLVWGLSQEVCADRAPVRARERTRKHRDSECVHVYEHVHVQGSIFHSLRCGLLVCATFLGVGVCQAQDARYVVRFKQHHVSPRAQAKIATKAYTALDSDVLSLRDIALQQIDRIPHDNSAVLRLRLEDAMRVSARSDVASIELDSEVHALGSTNDALYSQQYALNSEFGSRVSNAWDYTTGSTRALVAVIDTGADLSHADLLPNLWKNPKEVRGNKRDDDGNGCVDDIHGCDFINKDGSPQDDNGHGTHVTGIVAAEANNAIGVAGVAWGSKVVVVKALDGQGSGFSSGIAKAIDYITTLKTKGAPIVAINLSLGGGSYSRVIYRAVERARNHDILIVAAAGNETSNNDVNPLYPANLAIDSVVSVAATDASGNLASYSNYGAGTVHIAAPGSQIWSTALQSSGYQYRTSSGTSMASPLAAGVVSLIAAANPSLSMLQVRSILLSAVRPLASLQGYVITGAIVDAHAAVTVARATLPLVRIAGYVKNRSRGVADATITVQVRGESNVIRTTLTSGDGSYSFSELPTGSYIVRARKGKLRFSPVTVRASQGRTIKRHFNAR
jgi:subtilisin family serine protease